MKTKAFFNQLLPRGERIVHSPLSIFHLNGGWLLLAFFIFSPPLGRGWGWAVTASAQEAYAVYTEDNTTLTFYYDTQRSSRLGKTYDLNTGTNYPGWYIDNTNQSLTNVVFNSSFADARPTSTYHWFAGMSNLTTITGISNLNTSQVDMMAGMFSGCSSLTSLDLTNFNTVSVYSMERMFYGCSRLETIYVSSSWNVDRVTQSASMFYRCTSIIGGQGTTLNGSYVDKSRAHIDGGAANPGYLTDPNANSPYAVLQNGTLTFYYDNQRDLRTGTVYAILYGSISNPDWSSNTDITTVVFDSSFASYRPTRTYHWFYGLSNLTTITNISNLNTSEVTNMAYMFYGCSGLTSLDLTNFNTANVTSMAYMFYECSGLTSLDLSHFDTKNVESMWLMFSSCSSLTSLNVSSFNTENVTDMNMMFRNCEGLSKLDLSNFNTEKVKDMSGMFMFCESLTSLDLSSFNTLNVTNMVGMFSGCNSLTSLDLSNFNTASVTNMSSLFSGCKGLTSLDITNFNTANVTDISFMFQVCTGITSLDLSNFNTASVTNMSGLFSGCTGLTSVDITNFNTANVKDISSMFKNCTGITSLDLSNFNTASVTNMSGLFSGCTGLTSVDITNFNTANVKDISSMFKDCTGITSLDLSNFNTASVTNMSGLFSGCTGLTSLDLSSFNTEKVTNMRYMFNGCTNLTTIFVDDSWSTASVTSSGNMFAGCTKLVGGMGTVYESSHVDKEYARVDNAPSSPGYFTDPNNIIDPNAPYAVILSDGKTLQFRHDGQRLTMPDLKTYSLNTGSNRPGWVVDGNNEAITNVVFLEEFASARPTSMHSWFEGMTNLTRVWNPEYLNTSEVTDMANLFKDCAKLTSDKFDISGFTTTQVQDMSSMFDGCVMLTAIDVSHFDTQNVTDMASMFSGCIRLTTLNVSGLNTAKVTDMSKMFYDCGGYNGSLGTLDVTSFDTRQVTDMNGMFYHISARVDVTGFDTQNVTDMHEMFKNVSAEALDLHNFNTAKVTNMSSMFELCYNLGTITVGEGWTVENVTSSENMFRVCSRLTGEKGTRYQDENPMDKTYAHIDGGTGNPGYLTDINGPYAALSQDGKTLTFYKDGQRLTRTEKTYSLSTSLTAQPEWITDGTNATIEHVVFDASFAEARPVRTQSWFAGMTNLTSLTGMENLNTSEVTVMSSMFYGCTSLTSLDLSHFNTSKVTSMTSMFNGCTGLTTLDLMTFDTGNTTTMSYLFYGCTNLTTIYAGGGWSTAKVDAEYSEHMFEGCTSLVGDKGTAFDANHTDKEYARVDGGTSAPGYFSGVPSYAALSADGKTLTFYCDMLRDSRPGKTYDLNEGENAPEWRSDGSYENITTVVFDASFALARPTSTCNWFAGMSNLPEITGIEYLNTSEVTSMRSMFFSCSALTSLDVSHFDTQNVTSMRTMFYNCTDLMSLDLSSFNTQNVTNMHSMFQGCTSLADLDVSNFNTANVTDMSAMFHTCSSLTSLDLSNFNTANVTDMQTMFVDCSSLTSLDLSNFNTANVTTLSGMFWNCSSLTELDLSSFNTANVTNMRNLFVYCSNLKTIYVSDKWSMTSISTGNANNMFYGCTSLVGGEGTPYSEYHIHEGYAHIDGGTADPGYFSEKPAFLLGDVNGDGDVNVADVTALVNIVNNVQIENGQWIIENADVDGSGEVTSDDVPALVSIILGR